MAHVFECIILGSNRVHLDFTMIKREDTGIGGRVETHLRVEVRST